MSMCAHANARYEGWGMHFVRGDVAAKGVGGGQNGKKKVATHHGVVFEIFCNSGGAFTYRWIV